MNEAPHFAAHDLIPTPEKVLSNMLGFQSEPSSEKNVTYFSFVIEKPS